MKKLYAVTEHQERLIEMLLKEAGAKYSKSKVHDIVVFKVEGAAL